MNNSPYYYGQGRLYLSKIKNDGTPEDLLWLGDCSGLTLNIASEVKVKKTSLGGRRIDAALSVTDTTASLSFTLYEHNQENLARALWGTSTNETAGYVSDQVVPNGIKPGERFIICDASVWGVSFPGLEAGTDYKVEPLFGAVVFITPPPAGLTVSYYHSRTAQVAVLSTLPDDLYLRYEGVNNASPEMLITLDVYRVKLSPVDVFSLINNDSSVSSMSISARVMPDLSRYTGEDFDLFGRLGVSRRFDGAITLNIHDEQVSGNLAMDGAISLNFNAPLADRTVLITLTSTSNRVYTTTAQTDSAGRYVASIDLPFGFYTVVAECLVITPYNNSLTLISDSYYVEVPGPVVEFVMRIDSLSRPLFYARKDEEIVIDYGDGIDSTDFRFEESTDATAWCYSTRELIVGEEYHITVKGSATLRFTSPQTTNSANSLMELIKVSGDRTSMASFASKQTTLHTIHPAAFKLPLATTFTSAFTGCTGLTDLPPDLFKYTPHFETCASLFSGCSGLIAVPDDFFSALTEAVNFTSVFEKCTSLVDVGNNVFKDCTAAANFSNAFDGCTVLENLGTGIFSGCSEARAFPYCFRLCRGLQYLPDDLFSQVPGGNFMSTFINCSSLVKVPERLFRSCTDAYDFSGVLSGCIKLTSVPDYFFADLSQVTTFSSAFTGCTGLISAGSGVFSGCIIAQAFNNVFHNCRSLEKVADDIFSGCAGATTFANLFYGCTLLEAHPSFEYCPNVTNFTYAFGFCESLKTIKPGAFSGMNLITTFLYAFTGCISLVNIGAGAFKGCTSLTNLAYTFSGCKSLANIEGDIFSECSKVTNVNMLFNQCSGLVTLPEKLFSDMVSITAFSSVFMGCASLVSLPADLLAGCVNLTSLTQTFSGCTALASLPENLLSNNVKLTSAGSTFYGCTSLANIPATLFASCPLISSFNTTFQNTGITDIPAQLFAGNPLVTAFGSTFRDCINLLAVPDGLFDVCIKATAFSYVFNGCVSLERVASGLFNACPVTTIAYTFGGCIRLQTDINNIFNLNSYPAIDTTTAAFRGCVSMTGEGLLFINKVPNISAHYYAFNNCVSFADYDFLPGNWTSNKL